jgi:hypothetical protein
VPTEANLLPAYGSFAELRAACDAFCETVNARAHRETREPPTDRLAAERRRLHPIPAEAHTVAFGVTRVVDDDATLRFGSARYSVPHALAGERVWVRVAGDELVVTHAGDDGAREVARHRLTTPGNPRSIPPTIPSGRPTRSTRGREPRRPRRSPSSRSAAVPNAG